MDTTAPIIKNVPADLTVPATSASGAQITYLMPTATDIVDGPLLVSCIPASNTLFPVGDTPVTCTAIDAAGNTASETFTVIVEIPLSPQQIQNLISAINSMNIDSSVKTSLTRPLDQAVNLLSDSNPSNDEAVCGQLSAFISQVNTKLQNGQLASEQSAQLLHAAQSIKGTLSCT